MLGTKGGIGVGSDDVRVKLGLRGVEELIYDKWEPKG
jgi:hypothetical protein